MASKSIKRRRKSQNMPPSHRSRPACVHSKVTYTPSPHAKEVGYSQPSSKDRQNAMRPSPSSRSTFKVRPNQLRTDLDTFPAPLVLPDDDLALDPEYPPQSFQEWYDEEDRNAVTAQRRTVYVVSPPGVESGLDGSYSKGKSVGVGGWMKPRMVDSGSKSTIAFPQAQDVIDYLSAFYRGVPVSRLNLPNWKFTSWDEPETTTTKRSAKVKASRTRKPLNEFIGLATDTECIRIRTRPCPDGLFTHQLNLDDLLDAAISILPKDAYALCMLVHHDLFEDDDDTFVCGRAYGGSRVAVVSTARYNPLLDGVQGVERGHAWPAGHCSSYVEEACRAAGSVLKRSKGFPVSRTRSSKKNNTGRQPLEAALAAYSGSTSPISNTGTNTGSEAALWLWRVARTVSHELGHCFGIDHCVYYACIMQGSASLSEDTRQPPYLCPVDLAKVLASTGSNVDERDRALLRFCEKGEWRDVPCFRAYAGWLKSSLGLGEGPRVGDEEGGQGRGADIGGGDGETGASGLISESWKKLWEDLED
ncbi:hypothetical protein BJX63DRAFT_429107 [Aspergillus granulosus]|uniref:Uncharacterized protein n=1 Tax=Aspergillus granulosus TaxID=176169 RepID=A0ABR4HT67_9EURO